MEVLKDDQVDCPVEPPIGALQHKLTFIPIPREDLYECVQTIRTVLLLEIDRLNLVRPTTKVEKLNLVLDSRTKDLDFLSDSDKKACWSELEVEFERVVTEMQKVSTNDSVPAVQQQEMGNADKETGKQGEMKRSALHDDCHSSLERVKRRKHDSQMLSRMEMVRTQSEINAWKEIQQVTVVNGWMDNLLASANSVQKELTTPSTDASRATMKYKMLGEIARENIPVSAHRCDNKRMFRHAKLLVDDDLRHNLVPSTVSRILFLQQNKELIKDWMDLKTVLKGGVDMSEDT